MTLPAITVHQPWASLIVAGIKTIETRPAPPNGSCRPDGVRGLPGARLEPGDRLAIHAAATRPVGVADWSPRRLHGDWCVQRPTTQPGDLFASHRTVWTPLGAVLGTVRFDGAVPIVAGLSHPTAPRWVGVLGGSQTTAYLRERGDSIMESPVSDQLPLGDFAPGRWAWLLSDPQPTTDVCPTCEGDGCDPLSWEDPGTGEPPAPTAGCPTCGTPGRRGSGRCDPVPVRGHQGVWRWTYGAERCPTCGSNDPAVMDGACFMALADDDREYDPWHDGGSR